MLLFGGIWGLVGTVITVAFTFAGGPVWYDWILDDRGVRTEAQPFEEHATGSRINGRTVHEIQFRFTDASGQSHTGRTDVTDAARIASARHQHAMAIDYDPQDPARVRLAGASASTFGAIVLLPLAFAALGAVLFFRGLGGARRTRAIYRDGTAVMARVVSVERTSSTQNRNAVMQMTYEFTGPTGAGKGTWKTVAPAAQGATIWVLHDPARPDQSVPVDV